MTGPGEPADALDEGWAGVELLWSLDASVAHLNHGSFGAVPVAAQRAQQRIRDEIEANPSAFFIRGYAVRVGHAREFLARQLGSEPELTALLPNATTGVGVSLAAVPLGAGDEVLVTDHGYTAVREAVRRRCQDLGARMVTVAVDLEADDATLVSAVAAGLTDRTRLAVIDHIASATARLFPVPDLIALLHARGVPVIVDGAHAPGMLQLDLAGLGADFYTGNAHKWMCAPRGTAVLRASPRWSPRVRPSVVSHNDALGFPASFDVQGTDDVSAWLSASISLHVLRRLGWDRLRRRNAALVRYGLDRVSAAIPGGSSPEPSPGVAMGVIVLPARIAGTAEAAEALRQHLATEHRIEVGMTFWRDRALLRLSAQAYNHTGDYERLAAVLKGL